MGRLVDELMSANELMETEFEKAFKQLQEEY